MNLFVLILIIKGFKSLNGTYWTAIIYLAISILLSDRSIYLYTTQENDLIMLNVGGCLLPICMSLYMVNILRKEMEPGWPTVIFLALLPSVVLAYMSSYYSEAGVISRTIILPFFTVIIVNVALFIKKNKDTLLVEKIALAFVNGTFASIIGHDLLRLNVIGSDHVCTIATMGGAGVMDGIFISGLLSVAIMMWIELFTKYTLKLLE